MNIYNVIILDESGSMSSIYQETIQRPSHLQCAQLRSHSRRDGIPGLQHREGPQKSLPALFEGGKQRGAGKLRQPVPGRRKEELETVLVI